MSRHEDHFRIADASIRVDSMPTAGRDLTVEVAPEERLQLAGELGVTTVEALAIRLHAVRFRGGIRVTGRLAARVTQPSVVTLEPVPQQIDEPIDRVFLPGGEKPFVEAADAEVFVDLEGEDMPDHFEGNEADLTALIVETIALALDPYPRNDGEELATTGDADEELSPFAGLRALKDQQEP